MRKKLAIQQLAFFIYPPLSLDDDEKAGNQFIAGP